MNASPNPPASERPAHIPIEQLQPKLSAAVQAVRRENKPLYVSVDDEIQVAMISIEQFDELIEIARSAGAAEGLFRDELRRRIETPAESIPVDDVDAHFAEMTQKWDRGE